MTGSTDPEILNIEQAAALLGVSVKTFNRVLHDADVPARKIGREWKFSRRALIDWVGSGRSSDYYRDNGRAGDDTLRPRRSSGRTHAREEDRAEPAGARRTSGWELEAD